MIVVCLQGHKSTLLQSMAALLGLPRESSQDIISGCPSLSMNAGLLKIGRVQLNVDATASKAELFTSLATLSKKVGQFAMTAHARRVMESVAAAVKMSEPLLLVGESGTGKTASIQFLAEQVPLPPQQCCPLCQSSVTVVTMTCHMTSFIRPDTLSHLVHHR